MPTHRTKIGYKASVLLDLVDEHALLSNAWMMAARPEDRQERAGEVFKTRVRISIALAELISLAQGVNTRASSAVLDKRAAERDLSIS